MVSHREEAIRLLFATEAERACNLKFFPGLDREITAEQLAEQFVIAEDQIRRGVAVRVTDIDGDL